MQKKIKKIKIKQKNRRHCESFEFRRKSARQKSCTDKRNIGSKSIRFVVGVDRSSL